jgi:hypothetical protein
MNATTKEVRLTGFQNVSPKAESTEGIRYAQNALLSELPGAVFGLLTIVYIVSSLVALI